MAYFVYVSLLYGQQWLHTKEELFYGTLIIASAMNVPLEACYLVELLQRAQRRQRL